MPPRSGGQAVIDTYLTGSSQVREDDYNIPTGLSEEQITTLRTVSLVCSLFTLVTSAPVLYWFTRMRRSFRHDLIILIIVSDALEALLFAIFPIVYFVTGPIMSSSRFCQVSGFFLAVGIEASDIGVALVAIHTALYVFRAHRSSGSQSGLYPYRHMAYGAFYILPVVLGSLAFINNPAYANNGAYCYLPASSAWARISLSWGPRYFILLLILVLYACIYIYVAVLMRRFGEQSAVQRHNGNVGHGIGYHDHYGSTGCQGESVHSMPEIAYHGLIPSSNDSRPGSVSEEVRQQQGSTSTPSSSEHDQPRDDDHDHAVATSRSRQRSIIQGLHWKWPISAADATIDPNNPSSGVVEAPQANDPLSRRHSISHEPISPPPQSHTPGSGGRRHPSAKRVAPPRTPPQSREHSRQESGEEVPQPLRRHTYTNVLTALRRGPPHHQHRHSHHGYDPPLQQRRRHQGETSGIDRSGPCGGDANINSNSTEGRTTSNHPSANVTTSSGTHTSSSSSNVRLSGAQSGMVKVRERIRRQVGLLFIYPVVYMLVWLVPFISHVLQWDDPNQSGPFAMVVISLISLCLQGGTDSLVFAFREKPWRHGRRSNTSGRGSVGNGLRGRRGSSRVGAGGGESWKRIRRWPCCCNACGERGTEGGGGGFGAGDRLGSGSSGQPWWRSLSRLGRSGAGAGKTREEMLVDARVARLRRDIESAEREARPSVAARGAAAGGLEREWWERLENVEGSPDWMWNEEAGHSIGHWSRQEQGDGPDTGMGQEMVEIGVHNDQSGQRASGG